MSNLLNTTSGEHHAVDVDGCHDFCCHLSLFCFFPSAETQTHSRFFAVWNGLSENQKGYLKGFLSILTVERDGESQAVRDKILSTLVFVLCMNDSLDEEHVNFLSDFVTMLGGLSVDTIQGILALIEAEPIPIVTREMNGQDGDQSVSSLSGCSNSIDTVSYNLLNDAALLGQVDVAICPVVDAVTDTAV